MNVCREQGEAGLQLWEPLGEGQGQALLWDLGPWPQFPCFKAQDFVPGSLAVPRCGQRQERTLITASVGACAGPAQTTHLGVFLPRGTCRLGGCPAFKDSRKFKLQAFLLPGKGDWKGLERGPSGRPRLQAFIIQSVELPGF